MITKNTGRMAALTVLCLFTFSSCFSCSKNKIPSKDKPGDNPVDSTEIEEPVDPALFPDMVEIPEGSFTMGTAGASGQDYDEAPAHKVTVSAFRKIR